LCGGEIRANAIRVARVVVVRIAVVVDIREIRRRNDIPQPPVAAIQTLPYIYLFAICGRHLIIYSWMELDLEFVLSLSFVNQFEI